MRYLCRPMTQRYMYEFSAIHDCHIVYYDGLDVCKEINELIGLPVQDLELNVKSMKKVCLSLLAPVQPSI